jgi:hypothetical protein
MTTGESASVQKSSGLILDWRLQANALIEQQLGSLLPIDGKRTSRQ